MFFRQAVDLSAAFELVRNAQVLVGCQAAWLVLRLAQAFSQATTSESR